MPVSASTNHAAYFYPRSPCGERLGKIDTRGSEKVFLSTLSLRRATGQNLVNGVRLIISIHALLAESDPTMPLMVAILILFLSTLSLRRATHAPSQHPCRRSNFYPRSPCGERHNFPSSATVTINISIHALLAESDCYSLRHSAQMRYFYPRSPCGERHTSGATYRILRAFLSTLSLRRATLAGPSGPAFLYNFYPRSPCGERLNCSLKGFAIR